MRLRALSTTLFFLVLAICTTARADEATLPPLDVGAIVKGIPANYLPAGIDKAATDLSTGDAQAALQQIAAVRKGWRRPVYPDRTAYIEGLAKMKLDDKEGAAAAFRESVRLRASNSDVLFLLSRATDDKDERLNMISSAVWFNRYISTAFVPLDVFLERIKLLVSLGKTATATQTLEKTISANPTYAPARAELAELYLGQSKQQDAIKILRDGLLRDSANLDLKLELARVLLVGVQRTVDRPQIDEAVKLAAEVVQARGVTDKNVASIYARTLIEDQKPAEAQGIIDTALKTSPDDPDLTRLKSQIVLEAQLQAEQTAAAPTATPGGPAKTAPTPTATPTIAPTVAPSPIPAA